jgi:hypothetical protein
MLMELSAVEGDLIKRVLESHLSELRLEIRETKGDKSGLHGEEELVKALIIKFGQG